MKSKLLTILVFVTFLVGCTTKSTYYQSQSNLVHFRDISTLVLDLEFDEDKIYLVDHIPDPSERLAVNAAAMNAASESLQSTSLPANTSSGAAAAGAAAGMVIGSVLVNMHQDAKEQDVANDKAAPIQQLLSKELMAEMLRTIILNEANSQSTIEFIESTSSTENILLAEPELHFNFDLSRIEVKLNATVKDGLTRKTLYRNSFEYWSRPIGTVNNCDVNCALWIEEDASLLTTYLEEGCVEVMAMMMYDIEASLLQEQSKAAPQKTLKISSDRSTVYFRGSPVKLGDGRVWVKDLRGNMRSINGVL